MKLVDVADLRSVAAVPYEVAQAVPAGAGSLFGADAPFGSAAFATRDAQAISPVIEPPADPIPGWRATGSLWDTERFVIRIPHRWNGRLAVAGTPAVRSEFANDRIWSDPLLARGYAYVCGNKSQGEGAALLHGETRLRVDGLVMPRYVTPEGQRVSFWHHARGNTWERWMREFFEMTLVAQAALAEVHGRAPERTYAVGLSNGGNQVRHALEKSDLYAGGVAWNAVLWSVEHNLLRNLPQAIESMQAGQADRLEGLGFPPDVRGLTGASLYQRNLAVYWIVTAWLHAATLDPEMSIPYGDVDGPEPAEAWNGRIASWRMERSPQIAERIAAYAHTGNLRAKLIDIASEFDYLLPPKMHFEPYGRMVAAAGKQHLYRSALIPNAQHVDAWSEDPDYPRMRPGHPRAIAAFDELVAWVEG